jgi:hypothetical protein
MGLSFIFDFSDFLKDKGTEIDDEKNKNEILDKNLQYMENIHMKIQILKKY